MTTCIKSFEEERGKYLRLGSWFGVASFYFYFSDKPEGDDKTCNVSGRGIKFEQYFENFSYGKFGKIEFEQNKKEAYMIKIKLKVDQTGYDVVTEYIRRYWEHNIEDDLVVSLGVSYDGKTYEMLKEIVFSGESYNDVEFSNDWWEGQQYIMLFGIQGIREMDISGGIYLRSGELYND